MKTKTFLLTFSICTLSLIGCTSKNDINTTENSSKEINTRDRFMNEEYMLSPEETESFLLEGISSVITEDKTLNAVAEEYKQAIGMNEEIIITPNMYEDIYCFCTNRYRHVYITNIENTGEVQEALCQITNFIYSDLFYSTTAGIISNIVRNTEISVDYDQFTTEEAYLISTLVAMGKSMQYYAYQYTQVANTFASESDCWDSFCREIATEFGWAALNAIINGGISAATAFITGPGAIIIIIASTASTILTAIQLCTKVRAIYSNYSICLDLATRMTDEGITIVTNPNNDSTDESEWDNWERFLNCHIIKPSVFVPQIDECLQAQLIIP